MRDKSKRSKRRRPSAKRSGSARKSAPLELMPPTDIPIPESNPLSLHRLFEQQTRQMLDRTDLNEEQKQNILIAMSCPCCGAGAMSYTAKLKR